VAVKGARRRELAELVADGVLGDEHRDELVPLWTANVKPTMSGVIVERRDHVLMTRFSPDAIMDCTFFARCRSTNGPFLMERATFGLPVSLFRVPGPSGSSAAGR
jgi:hypothetical protein